MEVFLAFRNRHITVPAVLMLEALWLDRTELVYWLLATGSFFAYSGEIFSLLASGASPGLVTAAATVVADLGFALWHLALIIPQQCQRCCSKLPGSPAKCTACSWSDIKKRKSSQIFFLLFSHQSVISICCSCCRKRLYYLCELLKLVTNRCEQQVSNVNCSSL